jgi:hypothetical protein
MTSRYVHVTAVNAGEAYCLDVSLSPSGVGRSGSDAKTSGALYQRDFAHGLYEKFGFRASDADPNWMTLQRPGC